MTESRQFRGTPGPWLLKRSGVISDRETDQLVATTGYRVVPGSIEDDANAVLISASPQMLEALRCAERELRLSINTCPQAGVALSAVLDAIACATDVGGAA